MSRFIQVPAIAIRSRLAAAGFVLTAGTGEEVYDRAHDRFTRYIVRVYSSIQRSDVVEAGTDSIRVVALVLDGKLKPPRMMPIFNAELVRHTGSVEAVLDQMIDRAREAYQACNVHRRKGAA